MGWEHFIYFAITAVVLWAIGAGAAWKEKRAVAYTATILGLLVFFSFILSMWVSLEHPPLRTMGETRLWYSFFLPMTGIIVYSRWKYKWILSFSTVLSLVFICVNLFKPEIHSKTLMPALQSPWFAPHVIVYMFAYAVLGAATLMAVYHLLPPKFLLKKESRNSSMPDNSSSPQTPDLGSLDNLVSVGLAFMTVGMLFGALWAKEAWGHYWAWDPKETWAAITWFAYLVYIHVRIARPRSVKASLWILLAAFVLLQMCWWGINYLPAAQGASVHTYNM
ncbi:MAG: cytochrome c biogenesis protein CcsA [Prevotella sp.]|nr:cytochrome c biogenesis protein CcsA [Prevotella sp.]